MKRNVLNIVNIFNAVALLVIIGIILGYYQPQIKSYEVQVSNLTAEVANLEQTISSQEAQISAQQAQIATQEARISTLESEKSSLKQTVASLEQIVSGQKITISTLEAEKSKLQSEVSNLKQTILTKEVQISTLQTDLSRAQVETQLYKGQVNTLTSQLSSSEKRLDKILGITVTQGYRWDYQWQTWDWNLPIPLSLYVEYWERPRPREWSAWVDMAKDPGDDAYIDQMVRQINVAALQEGFTEVQKLNFVVGFVQSLPYTVDSVTTPYNEYPRYPIETLFNRGGDCEDTSILVAALLDRLGYDVALLVLKDAQHMAVGVAIPNMSVSSDAYYYTYKDKKYFYLETTGDGWQIGVFPSAIVNTRAYIYPLQS